ncbi:MAG: ribose-5-phosphate isomerase RpiA [Canidatus Methanoxibalbensis ujae]|nr:ribose-5-phosphate isomerase RpiA [Candidatus Methanoxibalbensis ujae]MCW7079390.1 ribose-5-phosphate isomerase RpiA [Candidatus Methanoxibalbensis ujae]
MGLYRSREEKKEIAAFSAASLVDDGMIVGLGTGSTAEIVIRILGERMKKEGMEISGVPTSFRTEMKAIEHGIPLVSLSEHPTLDIYIDGADEVDAKLNMIKGGWGSHTREKVVSYAARKVVICVEEEKKSTFLRKPVPLEVLPFAFKVVERCVRDLGGVPRLRTSERGGVFVTENGNIVLDADFGVIEDPDDLSNALSSIAGVVEHGIFTNATEVHIGTGEGVVIERKEVY